MWRTQNSAAVCPGSNSHRALTVPSGWRTRSAPAAAGCNSLAVAASQNRGALRTAAKRKRRTSADAVAQQMGRDAEVSEGYRCSATAGRLINSHTSSWTCASSPNTSCRKPVPPRLTERAGGTAAVLMLPEHAAVVQHEGLTVSPTTVWKPVSGDSSMFPGRTRTAGCGTARKPHCGLAHRCPRSAWRSRHRGIGPSCGHIVPDKQRSIEETKVSPSRPAATAVKPPPLG